MNSLYNSAIIILSFFAISCSRSTYEQKIEQLNQESNLLIEEFESLAENIYTSPNADELILDFEIKLDSLNEKWESETDSFITILGEDQIEELENENRTRLKKIE